MLISGTKDTSNDSTASFVVLPQKDAGEQSGPKRSFAGGPSNSVGALSGSSDGFVGGREEDRNEVHGGVNGQETGGNVPEKMHSKSSSYLERMGDYQREALEKLYDSTVDRPCQTLAVCENQIEEHMSNLNCQPLPFLSFLCDPRTAQHQPVYSRSAPIGPKSCEYCGSLSTSKCGPGCDRPKLFFLKKKPPFASQDGWDPKTDYRLNPFEPSMSPTQPLPTGSDTAAGGIGGEAKVTSGNQPSVFCQDEGIGTNGGGGGGGSGGGWTASFAKLGKTDKADAASVKERASQPSSPGWMSGILEKF